jgi:hypothetical protein
METRKTKAMRPSWGKREGDPEKGVAEDVADDRQEAEEEGRRDEDGGVGKPAQKRKMAVRWC